MLVVSLFGKGFHSSRALDRSRKRVVGDSSAMSPIIFHFVIVKMNTIFHPLTVFIFPPQCFTFLDNGRQTGPNSPPARHNKHGWRRCRRVQTLPFFQNKKKTAADATSKQYQYRPSVAPSRRSRRPSPRFPHRSGRRMSTFRWRLRPERCPRGSARPSAPRTHCHYRAHRFTLQTYFHRGAIHSPNDHRLRVSDGGGVWPSKNTSLHQSSGSFEGDSQPQKRGVRMCKCAIARGRNGRTGIWQSHVTRDARKCQ